MVNAYWNPFAGSRQMELALNRRWNNLAGSGNEAQDWRMPIDVVENDQQVEIRASLPGVEPEQIQATVEDGILAIKGETTNKGADSDRGFLMRERRSGTFSRSLRIPNTLDTENVRTHLENGVLSIVFPRLEARKPKQLKIVVGDRSKKGNNKAI
jgi:HSP20 family protein